jgi:hypothetical protein
LSMGRGEHRGARGEQQASTQLIHDHSVLSLGLVGERSGCYDLNVTHP